MEDLEDSSVTLKMASGAEFSGPGELFSHKEERDKARALELAHQPYVPELYDDVDGGDPGQGRALPGGGVGGEVYNLQRARSMQNGLSTTVPQSLIHHDLNCSHQPSGPQRARGGARSRSMAAARPRGRRESFEMKCCRINVLLVVMELGLGIVITALGFYMQTLTPSLKARELPYWAGIPVSNIFINIS